MRRTKKIARALMVVVLACLLTTTVFAAGSDSVWLNITQNSNADGTTATIVSGTEITDGQIELTYDAAALSYDSTEINDSYVAQYAVNTDAEGIVKIAWVATGEYTLENADWLIRVNFNGISREVSLSGTMNTMDDTFVEIAPAPDASELKRVVEEAKGLNRDKYTEESYSAVEAALENAEEVLSDPAATQQEMDEAAAALENAIAALKEKPAAPKPEKPSYGGNIFNKIRDWFGNWLKPSRPTPKPTEPTVPETTEPEPTVPETTAPAEDDHHTPSWGNWFGWIGKWFPWRK